jgi:hypothetical protein
MDVQERQLLENLRDSLKEKSQKAYVDAYLDEPSAVAVTKEALKQLKGSINESD